ncbi:antitoxin Xre/MbcA/ParS toxin-binding domain-containing protein [Thalassotalea euphylliae]|uniref:antitoxin Xre/MbcA/ParS toxin-binding domain-containing protein n=1 Tax=Thalassotalea euphylliae TaxID=1655234 RepID=UPI00363E1839
MTAIAKPNSANVLMKAFNNACMALKLTTKEKESLLGVNASTLSRKQHSGFAPDSKTGELQLHFIRLYRSLFAIAGGDEAFMQHWFRTHNTALNGIPAELCPTIEGLFRTNQYLDAMRGKI